MVLGGTVHELLSGGALQKFLRSLAPGPWRGRWDPQSFPHCLDRDRDHDVTACCNTHSCHDMAGLETQSNGAAHPWIWTSRTLSQNKLLFISQVACVWYFTVPVQSWPMHLGWWTKAPRLNMTHSLFSQVKICSTAMLFHLLLPVMFFSTCNGRVE